MFVNVGGERVAAIAKTLRGCTDITASPPILRSLEAEIGETLVEMERTRSA